MLIPLGTDRPLHRPTRVVYALMAINVLAFAFQRAAVASAATDGDVWFRAMILQRDHSGIWTYLTYAFLHDWNGIWHIVGNMLILWVFGPAVEDRFGRWRFLAFYLGGAVVAGLAHTLFSASPVVGASGAIAAVTGAFIVLFPLTRVRSIWLLGFAGFVMVPAWFFIGLALARDLFSIGLGQRMGVANEAHLGGYLFGGVLSFVLLWAKLLHREQYDLFSLGRQFKRRQDIRGAARISDATTQRAANGAARQRPAEKPDPIVEQIAAERAKVSRALAEGRTDDAIAVYRHLVERHGAVRPGAATLNRRAQFELGGELYQRGEHGLADYAFSRYIAAYPRGEESHEVRVLLARIKAEHLGETDAAMSLLESAIGSLREGEVKSIAIDELARLRGGGATA